MANTCSSLALLGGVLACSFVLRRAWPASFQAPWIRATFALPFFCEMFETIGVTFALLFFCEIFQTVIASMIVARIAVGITYSVKSNSQASFETSMRVLSGKGHLKSCPLRNTTFPMYPVKVTPSRRFHDKSTISAGRRHQLFQIQIPLVAQLILGQIDYFQNGLAP